MKKFGSRPTFKKPALVNETISFSKVLLIDEKNKNLGTLRREEALQIAAAKKLDLICVNPNASPPICKILNYDSYRFHQQKKAKKFQKIQKKLESKEIQLSASIANNDLKIKIERALKFLTKNFTVKLIMRLRGREKYLENYGMDKIALFLKGVEKEIMPVKVPKLKNNIYNLLIKPKKKVVGNHEKKEESS